MKDSFKVLSAIIIVTLGLAFLSLEVRRFFGPRHEQIRFQIHKESQSYRDGLVRRIRNLQIEHSKATDAHAEVIASTIRHEIADVDISIFPADLQRFLKTL